MTAPMNRGGSDLEIDEDEGMQLLRDRFRLSVISIAETEAKKYDTEISAPVMACISDLAFKLTGNLGLTVLGERRTATIELFRYTNPDKEGAEQRKQLAKDLELFAHHGNRKSVNMDDVILSAHRNEHVATLLRSMSWELKAKEPQNEKKRKRSSKKDERAAAADVLDLS